MKKIIGLSIAALLVIGLVAGGTWAYFSDTETSTGNTFTAGTIDLSIDPATGQDVETLTQDVDLKPCQTGYIVITLTNDGSNEMDVWKLIENVVCDENGTNEPEQDWYDTNNGGVAKNDIDTVILYDMWIDNDGDPTSFDDTGLTPDVMLINESRGLHIDDIEDLYMYLGTLDPEESMVIVQSYHMEADTENWAQSDTMTFDITFFAQQTVGTPQPPVPGTELSGLERP